MPTDRPNAGELVTAVSDYLKHHVLPTLAGQPAFHMRVAINALAIVERSLAEGGAMDRAEQDRLSALLDRDGELLDLNSELVEEIKSGEMDGTRDRLLAHLRQTALDKLRLANPRYLIPRD